MKDRPEPTDEPASEPPAENAPPASAEPSPTAIPPLDAGGASHLFAAVQQAGLLANADAIIGVRQREFREGRYQKAFDIIEGLSQQLAAGAAPRQGELRREEIQYKSARLEDDAQRVALAAAPHDGADPKHRLRPPPIRPRSSTA